MADQKQGRLSFLDMSQHMPQIVPKDMEEMRMIAAKRKKEQEDAARILLEKQVPVVTTPAPDEGLKTVAPVAGAVQPEIDENGKIKQTGAAGQLMDMIFGSFLK